MGVQHSVKKPESDMPRPILQIPWGGGGPEKTRGADTQHSTLAWGQRVQTGTWPPTLVPPGHGNCSRPPWPPAGPRPQSSEGSF